MNVTDYTVDSSTMIGPILPSRFGTYLLDLLKQWFSDPRNIPLDELKGLKYIDGDSIAAINASDVFLGIEWPDDQKLSGKTPAVLISYGNLTSSKRGSAIPMPSRQFPGHQELVNIAYDISVVIRTTAYAGTQVLSELIYTYLNTYSRRIQKDANLSSFMVSGLTPSTLSQSPGDSKDTFNASIVCKVTGTFVSSTDTTGPVFRGLTLKNNI